MPELVATQAYANGDVDRLYRVDPPIKGWGPGTKAFETNHILVYTFVDVRGTPITEAAPATPQGATLPGNLSTLVDCLYGEHNPEQLLKLMGYPVSATQPINA